MSGTGPAVSSLVDEVVRSFKVVKLFTGNVEKFTCLDFSQDGDRMVSCAADDRIVLYDVTVGEQSDTIFSKKYGVDLVRFAHCSTRAVHNSTKVNHTIRYLSLEDKKYIHYFSGHTKQVVSLCVSPLNDMFMSGSLDKSFRLWDLRSSSCKLHINVMGRPVTAFDPEGKVLAVGVNSETLKLFDIRFISGPFFTHKFSQNTDCDWTDIKFSPDGQIILIPTNGSFINLINAFGASSIQTLTGYMNNKRIPIEASFSPDSLYIFSGSTDGRIHVWNVATGCKVCVLNGNHPHPVDCVKFNPKYKMMASACTNMAFWLPSLVDNGTNLS